MDDELRPYLREVFRQMTDLSTIAVAANTRGEATRSSASRQRRTQPRTRLAIGVTAVATAGIVIALVVGMRQPSHDPVGSSVSQAPSSTTAPGFAGLPLGASGCAPASPFVGTEFRGTSADASLYGLVFSATTPPLRTGSALKFVWRMTGSGDLAINVIAPDGTVASGGIPVAHTDSSFNRPGDEWDSEYTFPAPGCWQIHLSRSDSAADVWLTVAG